MNTESGVKRVTWCESSSIMKHALVMRVWFYNATFIMCQSAGVESWKLVQRQHAGVTVWWISRTGLWCMCWRITVSLARDDHPTCGTQQSRHKHVCSTRTRLHKSNTVLLRCKKSMHIHFAFGGWSATKNKNQHKFWLERCKQRLKTWNESISMLQFLNSHMYVWSLHVK